MDRPESLRQMSQRGAMLCAATLEQAEDLQIQVHSIGGAQVLDFGVGRPGTIKAGIRLAEICLSGLADVGLIPPLAHPFKLPQVSVQTDNPVMACIGSQYAGWPFSSGKYFAMCSGPARLMRGKEPILEQLGLFGRFTPAIGIFEVNKLPTEIEVGRFADECQVSTDQVILCVARTASLPGSLQIVARSVETTLHKLHELDFDIDCIRSAMGTAPLPPVAGDDLTALGWTNDAILYGAVVNLWVDAEDEAIVRLREALPSSSSVDFGEPFLNIFNRYERDFYKIDKSLFSPAQVILNNLRTGKLFIFGEPRWDILQSSFGC